MKSRIVQRMALLLAIFVVMESEARLETPATPPEAAKTAPDLHTQLQLIEALSLDTLLATPSRAVEVAKTLHTALLKMDQISKLPEGGKINLNCVPDPNDPPLASPPTTTDAALILIERDTLILDIMAAKVVERGSVSIESATKLLKSCGKEIAGETGIPDCCVNPNCPPGKICSGCRCIPIY